MFELLGRDLLCIDFDLGSEYKRVQQLMSRYADLKIPHDVDYGDSSGMTRRPFWR